MSKQETRWKLTLLTMVIVLVLLAACGPTPEPAQPPATEAAPPPTEAPGPTEAPPEPTEAAPPPTEAAAAPTAAAPAAGEITEKLGSFAIWSAMPAMDPDYMLTHDHNVGFMSYETLTTWDAENGVQPKLATSWESNADGTEWTFKLREGVKFHDGTPFNAEAVKFSYERTIEVGLMAYYLAEVQEMEVVDDYTIRFKLSSPAPLPMLLSAVYGMFIKSPSIADKPAEWFNEGNTAGTGPYLIESVDPGTRVVFTRFPDYWGGWQESQFTKVVINIVEDPTVREQLIRSGEADVTAVLPYESLESLAASGGFDVQRSAPYIDKVYAFQTDLPPLDDVRVRQALVHAFPYEDVQKATYGGQATIAQGITPVGLWKPPADWQRPAYDLEKARALLQEAGVPEGTEVLMELEAGDADDMQMAQLWQAELAKIGIDLKITPVTGSAWWESVYNPDTEFHIAAYRWAPGYASPREFMLMFHSVITFIPFTAYTNPEYDALIDQAHATEATDPEKANDLYTQAQKILDEDAVGVWALDIPWNFVFRQGIEGYRPVPVGYDVIHWYDLR